MWHKDFRETGKFPDAGIPRVCPEPHHTRRIQGYMASALVGDLFLPYLLGAQNQNGGWGFHVGSVSRAEPTVWALTALRECASIPDHEESVTRALRCLAAAQLPDGSWPSSPELLQGSWVTSLASLALLGRDTHSKSVAAGLHWLTGDVPGEARLLRRVAGLLRKRNSVASQNDSYFGWSWTPGTASWVEPTAYAIIFIRSVPQDLVSANTRRRLGMAEMMLYDRMCPGGGWNCGNPMVYGVAGESQVSPTVWALLALRERQERPEVQKSLQWLAGSWKSIRSPGSLALALMALHVYGLPDPGLAQALCSMYEEKEILWNVPDVAWAALALTGATNWLKHKPVGTAD